MASKSIFRLAAGSLIAISVSACTITIDPVWRRAEAAKPQPVAATQTRPLATRAATGRSVSTVGDGRGTIATQGSTSVGAVATDEGGASTFGAGWGGGSDRGLGDRDGGNDGVDGGGGQGGWSG